jgi:ferrous iron transport protein B
MTIKDLQPGQNAVVTKVGGQGQLRQHFLDMGLIPGVRVTLVKFAPMGDPLELRVNGYELTLRLAEAAQIDCEPVAADAEPSGRKSRTMRNVPAGRNQTPHATPHPGLGEGGRFHDRKTEHPLPEGTKLTFALAGNQNCGKTTLFNQLTGSNQHVGNFPGVTVDCKSGSIRGNKNTEVTDLPGIYSMSPYTSEEIVSRQFILNSKPTGIINIVDATNIERNLYLTLQLLDLGVPMVVALNMMDEVQGNGGSISVNEMEEALGVPVVPISAAKNEGVDELIEHAVHVAKYQEAPLPHDFCTEDDRGGAVHRAIHGVMHLIEDHAEAAGIPARFAATKLLEGDDRVLDALKLDTNEQEMLGHITSQMEHESGLDHAAAIAEMRFNFIEGVVAQTVIKPHESKERERSRRIDKLLTGKYTAIPAFIGIMALIFWLTFNVIGAWLQDLLAQGIDWLGGITADAMAFADVNPAMQSLVIDGVFNGVGTVLSFAPIIVVMFFFLSLLEDTGYMARVAFVMDKLLRKIGLSGRSIVPMLIGFGCSVPAVMSSRTLPSERDRKMTVMMIPFMSCSAKLPIYGFLTAAFFPHNGALVMVVLYFTGILVGVLVALISKNTVFKGEAVPFVMELPNYRLPSAKSVGRLVWDKTKEFITRAFTVIFIATIVIWFLQHFNLQFQYITDASGSMLAVLAGWVAPVFAPLGFGDWRISTALITGFMAKESVVSTLTLLFGSIAAIQTVLTPATAFVLLVFCLLYTPCVAAITSIGRELGTKWALFTVVFQCVVAWIVAFAVRLLELAIL